MKETVETELLQAPFFVVVLGEPQGKNQSIILFNMTGEMYVGRYSTRRRNLEVGERLIFYTDSDGHPISWSFHGFDDGNHIGHANESKLKQLWEELAKRLGVPA